MSIERVTEFAGGYVLFVTLEDDGGYNWQILKGTREIDCGRYSIPLEAAVVTGRAALQSAIAYDDWARRFEAVQP
jgi:hypothetical protein